METIETIEVMETPQPLKDNTVKKNAVVVFLLWLFFGALGVHRMYAGKVKSGFIMLILFVVGYLLFAIFPPLGVLLILIAGAWYIIDLFLFACGKI